MGMPVDIKKAMGPNFFKVESLKPIRESLKPVEGALGTRVVKNFINTFNRFIDLFKTGRWAVEDQACVKLNKDVIKMSKVIRTKTEMLKAHPSVEQAQLDLDFRQLVHNRTEKICEIVHDIVGKKGGIKGKELENLMLRLDGMHKMNVAGMEHDHIILDKAKAAEKRPTMPFSDKISSEERQQMRLAKAQARMDLEEIEREAARVGGGVGLLRKGQAEKEVGVEREMREKRGVAARRRDAGFAAARAEREKMSTMTPQKAAHTLRQVLPEVLDRASKEPFGNKEDVKKLLRYRGERQLNALSPQELLTAVRETVQIVNKGYMELGKRPGAGLVRDLNFLRGLGAVIDPGFMERARQHRGRAGERGVEALTLAETTSKRRGAPPLEALDIAEVSSGVNRRKAVALIRRNLPELLTAFPKISLADGSQWVHKLSDEEVGRFEQLQREMVDISTFSTSDLVQIFREFGALLKRATDLAPRHQIKSESILRELVDRMNDMDAAMLTLGYGKGVVGRASAAAPAVAAAAPAAAAAAAAAAGPVNREAVREAIANNVSTLIDTAWRNRTKVPTQIANLSPIERNLLRELVDEDWGSFNENVTVRNGRRVVDIVNRTLEGRPQIATRCEALVKAIEEDLAKLS